MKLFVILFIVVLSTRLVAADTLPSASPSSTDESKTKKSDRAACLEDENLGACGRLQRELSSQQKEEPLLIEISKILCRGRDLDSCGALSNWAKKQGNQKEQLKWLRYSCAIEQNRGEACLEISEQAKAAKDLKMAAHWRKKACKMGLQLACK